MRCSRVPAERREAPCASGTRAGIQRDKNEVAIWLQPAIRRVAPRSAQVGFSRLVENYAVPISGKHEIGVSLRSPGHAVRSRGARSEPLAVSAFTMSNSAVLFVPAARCCARVGPAIPFAATPRGVGGAPTGAHILLSRLRDATDPRERGAARPMTRDARLSALHRGDFRPGAALPSPALPPDPCSELLAARSSCLAGGVPDLPSPRLRAAAAGRHSPLRLTGPSPEDAPP